MTRSRRAFVGLMPGLVGAAALSGRGEADRPAIASDPCVLPPPIRRLAPMTAGTMPITAGERRARLERARQLMAEHRVDAILLEPGTSLSYFTGVEWGLSERPFLMLIPAQGALTCICPAFEEARARERLHFPAEVRVWEEDESPYELVAGALRDGGIATGRLGMEEQVRFFVLDGVRAAAARTELLSAAPVTVGCR